ncbi:MAG: hypothetical protein L3J91_06550, partial [Thermoplasmata archaeon]|nr:hypothetical protein [Thermoplasmata archaeon]
GRSALTLAAPIVATYYRRIAYVARRRGAVAVADVELEPSGPTDAKEANAPAALPSELAEVRQLGFDAIGLTAPGLVLRVADGIEGQPMALAWALPPEFRDPAASLRASRPTRVPEEEVRGNVRRTLAYFAAWYRGTGDAGIDGRRDDGASVEFARAQVWQWMHREIPTDGGRTVNPHLLRQMVQEEVDRLMGASDAARSAERAIVQSARLLDELVTEDDP